MKSDLIARQYNPKVIQDAFTRVRKVPREQALLKVDKKENSRRPPLVVTYHPCLPPVAKLVRKHWEFMTTERPDLRKTFKSPSVVAYRRSKNLRDHLIRAKLRRKEVVDLLVGFTPATGMDGTANYAKSPENILLTQTEKLDRPGRSTATYHV